MPVYTKPLRVLFDAAEKLLSRIFPPEWNPLLNLGALGFFFYWIITVSGIYIYIFLDSGVTQAYESVEYMTHDQWYAAGFMRSFHRYASDGLVVVMLLHLLREFSLGRFRGVRWFSWVTGTVILIFVYVSGITGYWLVWDKLSQYVAIVSTEWLDHVPVFGKSVAGNFFAPTSLDNRFFSLMIFMHIAVPLIALGILWLHLQRVTKPRINPPRGLATGAGLSLLVLSALYPAVSQGPADLAEVPGAVGLDWFYLGAFPLLERLPGPVTWTSALVALVVMVTIPWLPPMRKPAAAVVDLANCNGCSRCVNDCPYNAITLQLRSDGRPFEGEAVVDPDMCVGCGICAGSCPTATPFRRMSELVPGIDLPDRMMADIRADLHAEAERLSGDARIMIFGCMNAGVAEAFRSTNVGVVSLTCSGQLPPSFIDYVITRKLADGVMIAGCADNSCHNRFGTKWTKARLAGVRDPNLRASVPRERIRTVWAGRLGAGIMRTEIAVFSAVLTALGPYRARHEAKTARKARETADE